MIIKLHLARTNGSRLFHIEKGCMNDGGMLRRYIWFVLNFIPGRLGLYFEISVLWL